MRGRKGLHLRGAFSPAPPAVPASGVLRHPPWAGGQRFSVGGWNAAHPAWRCRPISPEPWERWRGAALRLRAANAATPGAPRGTRTTATPRRRPRPQEPAWPSPAAGAQDTTGCVFRSSLPDEHVPVPHWKASSKQPERTIHAEEAAETQKRPAPSEKNSTWESLALNSALAFRGPRKPLVPLDSPVDGFWRHHTPWT